MREVVIQYVYALYILSSPFILASRDIELPFCSIQQPSFLTSKGYTTTAAVFAVECKLDQSVLQATPPGDDLETIVTNYCNHKIPTTPQIIIPPVKRTRKKNWIIMEPHASSVVIPTAINSFEHKRSHEPLSGYDNTANDTPPPKRPCASPRKSGTPRKHNVTPPMRSCDPVQSTSPGTAVSNQEELQLLGNSDIVDTELLQSVINDSQLPQQLADSINAALQSVSGATIPTGGSHDTGATSNDLVDRILENTQSDLLEFLTDILPYSDDND